jgi:hypothetical protein
MFAKGDVTWAHLRVAASIERCPDPSPAGHLSNETYAALEVFRGLGTDQFRGAARSDPSEPTSDRKETEMRKVIVNEFMSLDGVVQAPGAADEDTGGGFKHGGWNLRYLDELSQQRILEGIVGAGGFLLGRRTYEIFAGYWPKAPRRSR